MSGRRYADHHKHFDFDKSFPGRIALRGDVRPGFERRVFLTGRHGPPAPWRSADWQFAQSAAWILKFSFVRERHRIVGAADIRAQREALCGRDG